MFNISSSSIKRYLVIDIFLFAISMLFGVYYYWYRATIDTSAFYEVVLSLALASILLNLPNIICYYFKCYYYGMIVIFVLLFFVLIGFVIKISSIWIVIIASVLIVHQIILFAKIYCKSNSKVFYFTVALFIIPIFGCSLISTIYGQGYLHPLFLEKMALGEVHMDTLFHISISHLFMNYHIPSTGLHGLQYLHYHYGSHIIFAGLSQLIGIKPLVFYNLVYPLVFIPLFFKAIFIAVFKIQDYIKSNTSILKVVVLVIGVGIFIFPRIFFGGHPYASESNAMAILISFLFFSDVFLIIENIKMGKMHYLLMLLYYSFATIILVLIKVSVGYIFFSIVAYLIFREFSVKNILLWSFLILNGAFIFLFYKIGDVRHSEEIHTLKEVLRPNFASFMYYAGWMGFIAISYLASKGIRINKASFNLIIKDVKLKKTILWEILLVVSIVGAIPSIILLTMNGNDIFYFVNYQFYIGTIIGIPYLLQFFSEGKQAVDQKGLKMFFLIFLSIIYVFKYDVFPDGYKRESLLNEKNRIIISSQNSKNYLFLKTLSTYSFDDNSVIYVPKENTTFWNIQKFRPLGNYFTIPAITGLPQVFAFPFDSSQMEYGFPSYWHVAPPHSENDVILESKKLGFNHLYVLNNDLYLEKIDL